MTLPQLRQFGAASRSGCRIAIQLHFRLLLSCADKVGFVWISRVLIADSRSLSAVDAPCIGVPPATLIFAFGFGDEFLDDFVSDINWPAAEGGSFFGCGTGDTPRDFGVAVPDDVAVGSCRTSGFCDSPKTFVLGALCFELPAI